MEVLAPYFERSVAMVKTHPIATSLTTVGITTIALAYPDYKAYVALGPHGLPDNFIGWITQAAVGLTVCRKDTTVPAPYDTAKVAKNYGPNATKPFLTQPLKSRSGPRPVIPKFAAPQRQTTQLASEDRHKQMSAYLDAIVEANPTLLHRGLSRVEGPVPAVQLADGITIPSYVKTTRGECMHVHPTDGSTHFVLSLTDSKEAIEKGWGERHRMAGGILQWGYTLIYAPRDDEEMEVWKKFVLAAAGFCTAEFGEVQVPKGV